MTTALSPERIRFTTNTSRRWPSAPPLNRSIYTRVLIALIFTELTSLPENYTGRWAQGG